MHVTYRGQQVKLELHTVLGHQTDAGNAGLQEHPVLLVTEPSLQPTKQIFK